MLALKKKYTSKMEFVTANTTTPEGSSLAQKFDIYYIPVFFILDRQGEIHDRIEFPQVQDNPQQSLDSFISRDLQKIDELPEKGR